MGLLDNVRAKSGGTKSRSTVRLPPGFARTLELYGRWQFDPQGSGVDPSRIGDGNFEYELFMLAKPDGDAFIEEVAAVQARASAERLTSTAVPLVIPSEATSQTPCAAS